MIKQFNPEKSYKTVTGLNVLIYNWDCGGKRPIHGAVKGSYKDILWFPVSWSEDGTANNRNFDLKLNRTKRNDRF